MDLQLNYNDLFDDLGLSDLSPIEKEKHFQEMQDVIQKNVFLAIHDMLKDEDKAEFEAISDDEEYTKFLENRNINIVEIALVVAQKYREELLADMAYFDAKLN